MQLPNPNPLTENPGSQLTDQAPAIDEDERLENLQFTDLIASLRHRMIARTRAAVIIILRVGRE
jgi:hypothetical protein